MNTFLNSCILKKTNQACYKLRFEFQSIENNKVHRHFKTVGPSFIDGIIEINVKSHTFSKTPASFPGLVEFFFLLLLLLRCINRKNGHNTIKVAVQGTTNKSWHLKCEHISKQYTTNLDDVIFVK